MSIDYLVKGKATYAYIAHSKRIGKKVIKERENLGRVLDKEKGIFKSRERGVFTYNQETGEYGTPPADFTYPVSKSRRAKLNLDFGDTYLLFHFIETTGLVKCVEAIGYGNMDSLWALIYFYIISSMANNHCEEWYDGNYINQLFPKANICSQRITDMLVSIGDDYSYREFFTSYLEWFREKWNSDSDPNILLDSTGLPNSSHLTNTALNNHGGVISEEIRLIFVVQQGTNIPIYMRHVPGNVVDKSTIECTMAELGAYGIDVACCILDAGYINYITMKILFEAKISFVSRLGKEMKKLYQFVLDQARSTLEQPENAVIHNGRIIYVKEVVFHLKDYLEPKNKVDQTGAEIPDYVGYAYLCMDMATRNASLDTAVSKAEVNNAEVERKKDNPSNRGRKPAKPKEFITGEELLKSEENAGVYILISSFKQTPEEVVKNYASRDGIEKLFNIGKEYSKLLPLNIEKDDTLEGHLLVTFISTVIILLLKKALKKAGISFDSFLIESRNQKCKVFDCYTVVNEARKKLKDIYTTLNVSCPVKV